ncbi:MAG: dTDP-4-dehydrorhamnose 3,5-epimerase family protein [Actinomycetota bacterium]|nr:dTDP-4-dehydrorhamnose 3,5-epimerase family protein [Actinomycetota bacterium]MEC9395867.1 dTDP-4-dehydrorhamnose 3,5-epimerase family protein [Actinomycetota bacterium]MEE2958172.1 dTDP-4-dehydrorhamnose 3,5-epimerase family protein [Actinomycetota bacterium]
MEVLTTTIAGVRLVRPEVHADERGEFWRSFCRGTLAGSGVDFDVVQSNVSVNRSRHTLRGFHFQRPPSIEQKILTVVAGAAHVVVVDVRPDSPTFLDHVAVSIEPGDRRSVVIAAGCATGFLTLADDTFVHYQMGDVYRPEGYAGFRYDDPAVGVEWPAEPAVISERDAGFTPLDPASP